MGRIGNQWLPRVRSVSMNGWVGQNYNRNPGGWSDGGTVWKVNFKGSDLVNPGPVKTWVLIDEREDSINDGWFAVDMTGYPNSPQAHRVVDYPASYHNNAGGLAFADGHSEIHKWVDARTRPILRKGQNLPLNQSTPNNPDVAWLQARTTGRAR